MVSVVVAAEVAGVEAGVEVEVVAVEADCVGALYLFSKRIFALAAAVAAIVVVAVAADNCDDTDGVVVACFPAERTWTAVRGSPCPDCPCCDGAVRCQRCCETRTAVSGFSQ